MTIEKNEITDSSEYQPSHLMPEQCERVAGLPEPKYPQNPPKTKNPYNPH
ncbi:hypothetical protein [Mucilaginibacter hurinus]|nr:hypothetical protein [Mucilaginibacter hurinus]